MKLKNLFFLTSIVILFSLFSACKKNTSKQSITMQQQTFTDYEKDWAEVAKMEKKGLANSIITKVDSILEKALSEQNTPQIFKSLAYRSKYIHQTTENSNLKIFNQFESQIKQANFPLKQLLHSATAELYFQYYQQNRWQFQNRTETINFNLEDIRTWSLQDILKRVDLHYQESLTEKESQLSYPIENLKDILHISGNSENTKHSNGIAIQPSLYDFLAHRALNYYKINEGRVTTPQIEFKVEDYTIFAPAEEFVNIPFNTTDSNSNNLKTAKLYQELLSGRLKSNNESALIVLDLERLRHFYTSSAKNYKDSLYLEALTKLSAKFATSAIRAEIEYQRAKFFFDQGNLRNESNETTNQWYLKKAHAICETYSNTESFGGVQCLQLKQKIEKKSLELYTKKVYLPDNKIEFTLQIKNTDSIFFRLIKIPNKMEGHLNNRENIEDYIERLDQLKTEKTWSVTPTNPGDFKFHNHLYTIDQLQLGKYILISSTTKNLRLYEDEISIAEFTVSQLSYISENQKDEGSYRFIILNRKTGNTVENASSVLYKQSYDYTSRDNEYKRIKGYSSNKNGEIKVITNERENFRLQVSKGKDTLNGEGYYYYRYSNMPQKKSLRTHFFTDRAIYRPGQTVYFKGIVVEEGKNKHQIQVNYSTEVTLYNKNREKITSLKVKTNDYGSFEGNFVLPTSGLNGNYSIREKNGSQFFSVEEYKRPTFEIAIDTSKVTPKLNSIVSINGSVNAYSGAKISEAKINYRITRKAYIPFWSYWRKPFTSGEGKELANGNLVSNENGEFTFDFFAEADNTTASKVNQNYIFEITIDATSPSGETQSLTKTIQLGTQGYFLSTSISESAQLKDLQNLIIYSKNINQVEVDKKVNLKVFRLITPNKIEVKEYFGTPEYIDNKPLEKSLNELSEFERGKQLLSGVVNTNQKSDLIGQLPIGAYEIQVSTADGIELKQRFILFNEDSKKLAIPSFSYFKQLTSKAEPGDNAEFLVGSSLENLKLLYEVEVDGRKIESTWLTLKNEQQKIIIPVKENYRGDFTVRFIGVNSNRVISENFSVKVPFTNKMLRLELGTYRNKVLPGSTEKWTMSISGMNGEKLAAELLAGMYDKSLDQFKSEDWAMNLYRTNYTNNAWQTDGTFEFYNPRIFNARSEYIKNPIRQYPTLNWFGFSMNIRYKNGQIYDGRPLFEQDVTYAAMESVQSRDDGRAVNERAMFKSEAEEDIPASFQMEAKTSTKTTNAEKTNPVRTDFRESAFFYPQLRTDANGKISFEFDMPDALTKWKFRALAHTKDLRVGTSEATIQTQKELMVNPTFPRFFREGDQLNLKVLLTNLSEKPQNGYAKIRFYDAFTNRLIAITKGGGADQKFALLPNKNSAINWTITIPEGIQAIKYEVIAKSEAFSDGESKVIPVLSNRKLVTETLPLTLRGSQSKSFSFDKLLSTKSNTLTHESFSLEFTSNPAWYAIQALPYVTESNSECSEQIFARLYANLLAEKIANSNPRIKDIISLWKDLDSKELTSKLMQNQELKTILIEETPWLQQAKSETEQKKRIALLFDLNKMADEKKAALNKLKELQLPNGGWSWYKGMNDSRHITQYIINGFGHLKQLGVNIASEPGMQQVISKGIKYLDERTVEDYEYLKKNSADLSSNNLSYNQIHYIYTRSFFLNERFEVKKEAFNYYLKQADQFWVERNLYMKGMIGLALNRIKPESRTPQLIVGSLEDNAITSENLGMYWKENQPGFYWYNSAIETQALMVEVFQEITKNPKAVDELRVWLLKQKQTQMWPNSKATALACYALLIGNNTAFNTTNNVMVRVDGRIIQPSKTEAGTGYFKEVWTKNEVAPKLGQINASKNSKGVAWGAAYWQYYENLDKISTASVEEFSVSKTMFKVEISQEGEKMTPIEAKAIKIGDKIRIRLKIESKRNLEFVHVKDMRASGFEPTNVISRYKYQDGLGYYESTKDASTNFFMDRMNKGVYVFEYDLRATVSGEFSNGICTLQCQYAPEFATHSKGKRVTIGE